MLKGTYMFDKTDLTTLATVIIAIIVVLGGGIALVFKPDLSDKIIPMLTLVLGFFFSSGNFRSGLLIGQQNNAQNTDKKTT